MKQALPHATTEFIHKVLTLYRELPETPLRVSLHDQKQATELQLRGIPLELIEAALLLGSLRRLLRPPWGTTLIADSLFRLLPTGDRGTALPPSV
jgi:hypothetical protein